VVTLPSVNSFNFYSKTAYPEVVKMEPSVMAANNASLASEKPSRSSYKAIKELISSSPSSDVIAPEEILSFTASA
jgi:hypothetical protein